MRKRLHAGFTLVEIMVVVAIIGLLVALALPGFSKSRVLARNARFINDLRVACNAFVYYAQVNGSYPADSQPGQYPAGMRPELKRLRWTRATPIGGRWDWDYGQAQFGGLAGVSVYQPARTDADMQVIDTLIDDGDLAAGAFRKRSDGYICIIEP